MDKENINPWTTLSSKEMYDNPWIRVTEHQVINPGGGNGIYGKVHFKNKAIGIVPLDDEGNTWLVGQYRYPLGEYSWEIPEGGAPVGSDPLATAQRELQEETGLMADYWQLLTRMHVSNSVTDEEGFIYMAEGIHVGKNNPEESEADLKAMKLPLNDAVEMVLNGKITDSISMIGLLLVARLKGIKA